MRNVVYTTLKPKSFMHKNKHYPIRRNYYCRVRYIYLHPCSFGFFGLVLLASAMYPSKAEMANVTE